MALPIRSLRLIGAPVGPAIEAGNSTSFGSPVGPFTTRKMGSGVPGTGVLGGEGVVICTPGVTGAA